MPVEVCLGSTLRVTSLNVGGLKLWAGAHCIPALNQTHVNSGRGGGVRVTQIKKKTVSWAVEVGVFFVLIDLGRE